MNNTNEVTSEQTTNPADDDKSPNAATDESNADEFKLTIKKLEMPVRPRGVLAE